MSINGHFFTKKEKSEQVKEYVYEWVRDARLETLSEQWLNEYAVCVQDFTCN